MDKENDKKCKWKAPNGQQYDCKPSPICGDCENNTFKYYCSKKGDYCSKTNCFKCEHFEKKATAYALEWGDKTDGTYACCKDGYLAAAEPREKRIAELIALINAERKRQEECDDVHLRKIKDLETELAKRAEQIEALNKDKDYFSNALDKQIEATYKVIEKLNKAKEIIKEIVGWANWQGNSKCPSFKSIQDKAEAFLKEE